MARPLHSKKQVILLNNLLSELYPYNTQHRVKPVLSPSAQSITLCDSRLPSDSLDSLINSVIAPDSPKPVMIKAVIELMYLNGLRISEVLHIKGSDIAKNGVIKIHGSKGSFDRIAVSSIYKQFWISRRAAPHAIDETFSRFFFYREFKKIGISITNLNGNKNAVTHAFRHLLVTNAMSIDNDLATVAHHIGHKNSKNTKHYDHNTTPTKKK